MRSSILAVTPLMLAWGCASTHSTPVSVDPNAKGLNWVAHLSPTVATGTRITGEVRVTPSTSKPNASHIVLNIMSNSISTRHPWVIASGTCTDLIPVELGGRPMYQPIDIRTDGNARLTQDVPVIIPIGQRYHVALFYQPTGGQEVMVACGELAITGAP